MNAILSTCATGFVLLAASSAALGCGADEAAAPLVVFDGDSLTAGYLVGAAESYPRMVARGLPEDVEVHNLAVSGQTWPDLIGDAEVEVDALLSDRRPANIVVAWAAANDLAMGLTAEEVAGHAATYCAERRRRGFIVVVLTMYPLQPEDVDADFERRRRAYNELLRARWPGFADALVDIASDERLGDASGRERARLFIDVVHLNGDGYAVVADLVTPVVRRLLDGEPR